MRVMSATVATCAAASNISKRVLCFFFLPSDDPFRGKPTFCLLVVQLMTDYEGKLRNIYGQRHFLLLFKAAFMLGCAFSEIYAQICVWKQNQAYDHSF